MSRIGPSSPESRGFLRELVKRQTRDHYAELDAHDVGLALSHEGPGWFIIGDDGNPLHKHAVVRLP